MRLILAGCALAIAGAGTAFAEPRNHSGFTSVEANAGTDVTVTVGSGFSVDVTGPGASRIVTRVDDGTLIVERQRGFHLGSPPRARITVTMPRVDGLSASSGADLAASGVNADSIVLDASSGADLRVSGRCGVFVADVSSGADIHAQELHCENGRVDASSGADARVHATGRLDVEASSGGGVVAYGAPDIGNIDLSSGGTLRRAD